MSAKPDVERAPKAPLPWTLYLHALCVIIVVRLSLTFLGYKRLEKFLPPPTPRKPSRFTPWQIAWSVRRTAIYIPFASCLTQAISLQYLLGRRGEPSCMYVGVAPTEGGRFAAHAWLMWDDQVIIGGNKELRDFSVIARLEAKPA